MKKILCFIALMPMLASCAALAPRASGYGQKTEISAMRFGVHEGKTRIVLDLSSKCSEDKNSHCNYRFSRNGNAFSLVMNGAVYSGSGVATVSPAAEIKTAYIEDVSGGIELKGTLADYAGREEIKLFEDPYRLAIDVFRKTDQESQAEEKIQAEYTEEEKTQSVALLDMRYGKHADRTRVVFDLSDSCVWSEEDKPDYFELSIKGASSKIKSASGTPGPEVRDAAVSLGVSESKIKVTKGSSGGKAEVQLLEPKDGYPYYRLIIDVFALKAGQTKQQLYSSAAQYDEAGENEEEDLNQYDELVPQVSTQDSNTVETAQTVSDQDRAAVGTIKPAENKENKLVIVIDPGHGGKFGGATYEEKKITGYKNEIQYKTVKKNGKKVKVAQTKQVVKNGKKQTVTVTKKVPIYKIVKRLREQDLTLTHSKIIKKYFDGQKNSPFKVILTRETDKELGKTLSIDLAARNKIAEANDAIAFVSMHINAAANCSKKHGFEILYRSTGENGIGKIDKEVHSKVEMTAANKAILEKLDRLRQEAAKKSSRNLAFKISDKIKEIAGIPQYKQPYEDAAGRNGGATVAVLRTARFAAVLIESGYICNEKDRQYMQDEATMNKVAEAIYESLMEYGKEAGWKGVK